MLFCGTMMPHFSLIEVAGFFEMALKHRLVEPDVVVRWIDEVIAQSNDLPGWTYELSTASNDVILDVLQDLPRERDWSDSVRLFGALLWKLWNQQSLPSEDVCRIAYHTFTEPVETRYSWSALLDLIDWKAVCGIDTDDELRAGVKRELQVFETIELPFSCR